jgi:hypothetical protein
MLIWIMLKVAKTDRTFCVLQGCQLAWGTGLSLRAAAGRVAVPTSGLLPRRCFIQRQERSTLAMAIIHYS